VREHPRGVADWLGVDVPDRTCAIAGCAAPVIAREMCNRHYKRWLRGAPLVDAPPGQIAPCSVADCTRPAIAREMCTLHYQRWQRNGTTELQPRASLRDRLLSQVDRSADGCWNWLGQVTNNYGRTGISRSKVWAHRASYEEFVGRIPPGFQIDHLCKNTVCINPDHLEAVTPRVNTLRSDSLSAIAARRTHCAAGHEYTDENTRQRRDRRARVCRTCARADAARRRACARRSGVV
jgi:hypothetical protein